MGHNWEHGSTPDRILTASNGRLADLGFEGARLTDITADAGLTTGAFYRYFAAKENLYTALFDRFADAMVAAISDAADLLGACRAIYATASEHAGALRSMYELSRPASTEAAEGGSARQRWTAALLSALPDGLTVDERRAAAAVVVDIALRHAYNMSLEAMPQRSPTEAARALAELIEDGVYVPGAYVEVTESPPQTDDPPPASFEHVLSWEPSSDKSAPSSTRGLRTWNAVREAATRVFSRHGLANTTVLDIAQEAGVSSGTVYRYFVDKEDIFRSLQALVEEEIISESHLPMDRGRILVREQFVAYIRIYRRHLGLFRAWLDLIHSDPHPSDAWFAMRETFQDRAARILRYGRRHGIVRDSVRIPVTSELYVMAHEGPTYCHLVLDWNQGIGDSDIADAVTSLFNEGLA